MKREQLVKIIKKYEEMPFSRPYELADDILALRPTDEEIINELKEYSKDKLYSDKEFAIFLRGWTKGAQRARDFERKR